MVLQKIIFNWIIIEKNCLMPPYQWYHRHVIHKFCTGYLLHHSGKVPIHCAYQFQRRRIKKNQPIRNKNCSQRPCFCSIEMNVDILQRTLIVRFSFFLLSGFRGEDFYKLTNQKQEMSMAACLLSDFNEMNNLLQIFPTKSRSFGQTVSEENIFRNRTTRTNICLLGRCL